MNNQNSSSVVMKENDPKLMENSSLKNDSVVDVSIKIIYSFILHISQFYFCFVFFEFIIGFLKFIFMQTGNLLNKSSGSSFMD